MGFRDNFLFYTIVPLLVLLVGASYYRFMVARDYTVAHEGACDEYTENCFIGCEDDECTSEYYYTKVHKYAPTLYEQCGVDITDCEDANSCLDEEEKCTVTYCDTEIDYDACESYTEADTLENSTDNSDTEAQEPSENVDENSLENTTI